MHGWLQFGQRAFLHSLQRHQAAIVQSPDGEDINGCVEVVAAEHPLLGEECIWAAADDSKLHLQQSSHWLEQNVSHNGWLSHACIDSVFVVALNRLTKCATIGCPGS